MSEYQFFMRRAVQSGTVWELEDEVDLESHFKGLRYKSCTGLGAYGKPKGVYTESYAEQDGVSVYVSAGGSAREQTDVTLTLYFFDPDKRAVTDIESRMAAIEAARGVYESFMAYISGCVVMYRDTARGRKVALYLSDNTEPSTDSLKGVVYLEVSFKFKNMRGCPFPSGTGDMDILERKV